MFQRRYRQQQQNYGVLLLAYHLMTSDYIPPVTLGTILLQVAIFLGFIPALDQWKTREMCLLPSRILQRGECLRMLASQVMHADDMHLYYNMVSFLWKGRRLESHFGHLRFFLILLLFCISTSACVVGISYIVEVMLGFNELHLMQQCAVGFSGVIFALKVLHTHYFPYGDTFVFGWLPISSRYVCWAELILIQLLTPNASFIGHLAGILVGLLYINGPLKIVVDGVQTIIEATLGLWNNARVGEAYESQEAHFRNWGSGITGGRDYSEYTAGMSEEEQLRFAREESMRYRFRPTPDAPPYPENDNFG